MSKIKIKLNHDAVRQLLKSKEMQNILKSHAQDISGKVGGEVEVYVAGTRAIATVKGDDGNNKLLKGIR